mgnify:FL=1
MKRFPSIKKNSDFQNIYRNGKSYANRLLVMYVMRNGEESNQLGISVSKKVGKQCGTTSYCQTDAGDIPAEQ